MNQLSSMSRRILFSFFCLIFNTSFVNAQITYTALHTETTFNAKAINVDLAVGSTSGSASVSSGAANYTIPIGLPPGTNGVAPSLSISYNSMGGNGIMGMGWGFSGTSLISRVNKTVYHNSLIEAVKLDENDPLSLDGNRLIYIGFDPNNSSLKIYKTESETFSRIAEDLDADGFSRFKVLTKDGVEMEYGFSSNSKHIVNNYTKVLYWKLNKITNPDGNYIEFIYDYTSDRRLTQINYTGNTAAGLVPYNKIKFEYETRTDINKLFEAGAGIDNDQLLVSIKAYADSETEVAKSYEFKYGFDNVNSYLVEVSETGSYIESPLGSKAYLNSTIFKYGSVLDFGDTSQQTIINYNGNQSEFQHGDFDGDGYSDIMTTKYIYSNGQKYNQSFQIFKNAPSGASASSSISLPPTEYTFFPLQAFQSSHDRLLTDYTGDGTDDLVYTSVITVGNNSYKALKKIRIYKSDNNATSFTIQEFTTDFQTNSINKIPSTNKYIYSGDFNGDGIQDILLILGNASTNNYTPRIYFGGISTNFSQTVTKGASTYFSFNDWANATDIKIVDFDGDGKSEIMIMKDLVSTEFVTFVNGGIETKQLKLINFDFQNTYIYCFGDFNGDRKTDILYRISKTDNAAQWKKAMGTGAGFEISDFTDFQTTPKLTGQTGYYLEDQLIIADINGDGKSDIYHGWNYFNTELDKNIANLDVYYSRGATFYFEKQTKTDVNLDVIGGTNVVPNMNGDNTASIVNLTNIFEPLVEFRFGYGGTQPLLACVKNGIGLKSEWTYQSLAIGAGSESPYSGTLYTRGTLSNAVLRNIQPALFVVQTLKIPNGKGGVFDSHFGYEGLKFHREGKGLLGFSKIITANVNNNTKSISSSYFNSTFFAPVLDNIKNYFGSELQPKTETIFTTSFDDLGSKRFFTKTTNSILYDNFAGGKTVTTTNTFDTYGNITKSIINNNSNTEVITTDTEYGTFPLSTSAKPAIPSKPINITVTKKRGILDAFSVKTTNTFDETTGQILSKIDFSDKTKKVKTDYEYLLGNLTKTTVTPYESILTGIQNISAGSNSIKYDPKGRFIINTTNELDQSSSVDATFDPNFGKLLTAMGIDGIETKYTHDAFGRPSSSEFRANFPSDKYSVNETYFWDSSVTNSVYRVENVHPGKPDTKTWCDILGRAIKTETEGFGGSQHNLIVLKTYDSKGNVLSITNPYKANLSPTPETPITTTFTYDDYNRVITSTSSVAAFGSGSSSYIYENYNLKVTTTSPDGKTNIKITDPSGKLISATDNNGSILYYFYNSQNNLVKITDGTNTISESEFDLDYGQQTKLIDKNAGTVLYEYNSLNQISKEINAKGEIHTMVYDKMGRNITRNEPVGQGSTQTSYFPSGSGASTNQLMNVANFSSNTQAYSYDNLGRLSTSTESIDSKTFITIYEYDKYDNLTKKTYPSGLITKYNYETETGYPTTITKNDGTIIYSNKKLNSFGQNTEYDLGNGQTSTNNYVNGVIQSITTPNIQNLVMDWNLLNGNLKQRKDLIKNRTEDFLYTDNLDRLTSAKVDNASANIIDYAPFGNINSKSDVGTYSYHSTKINAVISVTNPQSIIPLMQQDIAYNSFQQPTIISENSYSLAYTYGSDYNRIKGILKQGNTILNTRYYFGDYEQNITGSTNKDIHYIGSPAGLIAIIERVNGVDTYHYTYTDHLGSIVAITSESGTIEAELHFDAWGRRCNINTWVPLLPTAINGLPDWLYRGYTGHEMLDQFGLINMNARLYDPMLGRVLSPDNYVQNATSPQAYNRYSYANNNPLKYTDPDGNNIVSDILVSGVVNWLSNGAQFNKEGLGSFLKGAGAGAFNSLLPAPSNIFESVANGVFKSAFSSVLNGGSPTQGVVAGGIQGSINYSFDELKSKNTSPTSSTTGNQSNSEPPKINGVWLPEIEVVAPKWAFHIRQYLMDKKWALQQERNKYSPFSPDRADVANWGANALTALKMYNMWQFGIHSGTMTFENDKVANAMRNAWKVNLAREYFYDKYRGASDLNGASVTDYNGKFGAMGLINAGIDPIEQFVGTFKVDIHAIENNTLKFTIRNKTSFTSYLYGIGPSWNGGPMGNFSQTYIFTEPLNIYKITNK